MASTARTRGRSARQGRRSRWPTGGISSRSWASSSSSSWTSKPARRNPVHSSCGQGAGDDEGEAPGPEPIEAGIDERGREGPHGRRAEVGHLTVSPPAGQPGPFTTLLDRLGLRHSARRCPRHGGQRTWRALPAPCTAYRREMLLFATDPAFEQHDTGPGHPERARRLEAALRGPEAAGLTDAVRLLEPREATPEELSRVHPAGLPRGAGALLRRRRGRHRRRHPGVDRVVAGRQAGRRRRPGGDRGPAAGRGRRRLPGRPPARAPRPGHPADGLLPDQQHRRGRRQPGRAG